VLFGRVYDVVTESAESTAGRRVQEFVTDGRAGGTAAVDGAAFRRTEDDICYNVLAREKESFINVQHRALSETYSSATLRWIWSAHFRIGVAVWIFCGIEWND
jgi:hypothetical protein